MKIAIGIVVLGFVGEFVRRVIDLWMEKKREKVDDISEGLIWRVIDWFEKKR